MPVTVPSVPMPTWSSPQTLMACSMWATTSAAVACPFGSRKGMK